jgi:hypothetical protein
MLVVQTVLGAATALFVFVIARQLLAVRFVLALTAAAVIATEPSQVFFERMLMAESAGTFCFVALLASGLAYVVRPHPRWLVYGAIAGVGAVSFRLNMLPTVLGMALLPPLVALLFASRGKSFVQRAAVAAAMLAMTSATGAQ